MNSLGATKKVDIDIYHNWGYPKVIRYPPTPKNKSNMSHLCKRKIIDSKVFWEEICDCSPGDYFRVSDCFST